MKRNEYDLFGEGFPFRTNMRKAIRERKAEKKRLEFVAVRKAGGGARERLRRKLGGFHTLHHRPVPCEEQLLQDRY